MTRWLKTTALLLVPSAAIAVLALYLAGALPYRLYVIHTGSMSPTIPTGSVVLVREHRYQVGQAVTLRIHGTLVTHRLVAVNADGTIDTKGDADRSNDPWHARATDIVGGVVLAPHWLGYALVYLRQPAGAASIVLALLLAWQTWSLAGLLGRRAPARVSPAAPLGVEPGSLPHASAAAGSRVDAVPLPTRGRRVAGRPRDPADRRIRPVYRRH